MPFTDRKMWIIQTLKLGGAYGINLQADTWTENGVFIFASRMISLNEKKSSVFVLRSNCYLKNSQFVGISFFNSIWSLPQSTYPKHRNELDQILGLKRFHRYMADDQSMILSVGRRVIFDPATMTDRLCGIIVDQVAQCTLSILLRSKWWKRICDTVTLEHKVRYVLEWDIADCWQRWTREADIISR